MKYFKINYNKLENLHQIKFYKFIILILIVIIFLIIISLSVYSHKTISFYGIYKDNILQIKINKRLSDIFNKYEYIEFNNKKINCKLLEYGDYEIINEDIYQILYLTIDQKFLDNDVGILKVKYDKKKVLLHVLDLFK